MFAIKGASALKEMALPMGVTLIGIVFLTASVNLLVGSASAKWALIGAVMVPMLMELGVSPDFTQAAYRVGDSSTNIITPVDAIFSADCGVLSEVCEIDRHWQSDCADVTFFRRPLSWSGLPSCSVLVIGFTAWVLVQAIPSRHCP